MTCEGCGLEHEPTTETLQVGPFIIGPGNRTSTVATPWGCIRALADEVRRMKERQEVERA